MKVVLIVCFYACLSVMTGLFMLNSHSGSEAAIAVVDVKNIAEATKGYLEQVKTVQNTLTQIQNQMKDLSSLSPSNILNFSNQTTGRLNTVADAVRNAQGDFLKPGANPDESWAAVFLKIENWGVDEIDDAEVKQALIHNIDVINKDAFRILKANNTSLESDMRCLNDLMVLNQSAEGNKQVLQVNNMLQAHANELKAREIAIRHAEATATIAYYQSMNQSEAQAANRAQKVVNEFEAVSKDIRQRHGLAR